MIGWWIVVAARTPEERDGPAADRRAAILATWEVSTGRKHWLMRARPSSRLSAAIPNGTPAKTGEVLPLLADGPPPHRDMAVIGDLKLQIAGLSAGFDSGICCVTGTQRTSRACFSGGGISSQWRR